MKDEIGTISFRGEGDLGVDPLVSDSASMMTTHEIDDDVTTLCMLNAQFHWLAVSDEPVENCEQQRVREQEQESGLEQEPATAQPQSQRSRCGSNSSTLTIWPSGFDEIPLFETDEFGNQVEVPGITPPVAAHLARHGYIHPDEFEMEKLDEPPVGNSQWGRF